MANSNTLETKGATSELRVGESALNKEVEGIILQCCFENDQEMQGRAKGSSTAHSQPTDKL